MSFKNISVVKARVHNLQSLSVKIPKDTLTVITGPSGSGKSSLAFDTIYVEGQRRYIESLSSYARQFLGQHRPPDVESISGLSPAIAIDQKTSSRNPRSTVGTITEIYDYLRVLFARVGTLYCPKTGQEVKKHTSSQVTRELTLLKDKTKLHILSRISFKNKADFTNHINNYLSMGFTRCYYASEVQKLEEITHSDTKTFYLVVDRVIVKGGISKRLNDSIEHAYKLGHGSCSILIGDEQLQSYSEVNRSPVDGTLLPELGPNLFSFNSPVGACKRCNGIGQTKAFDKKLMIFDENLSIINGALAVLSKKNRFLYKMVLNIAEVDGIDLTKPYKKLPISFRKLLFDGSSKTYTFSFKSENSTFEFSKPFKGLFASLNKKFYNSTSEKATKELEKFMNILSCPDCKGGRLNPCSLSTLIGDKNIVEISSLSIEEAFRFMEELSLDKEKTLISEKLVKEIKSRFKFLIDVGLDYLSLNRPARTLSGGEGQRIRLATQIGSALSGVLYVLDEPSIGLHQKDNNRLIKTLKSLRDLGNTVLVVEHDEDTILASDYVIDMGPGAGIHGGTIVAKGTLKEVLKNKKSLTAKYINKERSIFLDNNIEKSDLFLKLRGANQNNVLNVNVSFPLNSLVCITGVSGSGKSTLLHEVLVPAVRTCLSNSSNRIIYQRDNYHSISGVEHIKSLIELDQSPIGRTPHSNPATYTAMFDEIRAIFSKTPDSQVRGYKPGRFSFNVKGGRCDECEGNGVKKIEMHFLPDVYITCSECHGSRYNNETLSVLYKGKSISDILKMSVEESYPFFKNYPKLERIISTLKNVGLGYLSLGQPATTLSGGEAQRLKLARELAKKTKGHCLYILDEPTTGLHFQDIDILLKALHGLVERGHSVFVIEHNLDVIKNANHIIDLGPNGGNGGGKIVFEGTPKDIVKSKVSHTGKYLKKHIK